MTFVRITIFIILLCLYQALALSVIAQTNDDCLACHDDPDLKSESGGRKRSLYLDLAKFSKSTHADLECVSCHTYLEGVEEFPHEVKHEPVDCGNCHDDIAEKYNQSLHGMASAAGVRLAPKCWDCHSKHDIKNSSQAGSQVARFNIPYMCGSCHKEGTEVTRTYSDILPDSILSHYSESIHGEGLYKQGLSVTAVCTSCHTGHNVLPHVDPKSTIHKDNVRGTCMKCHGRIEEVHRKVIAGELWEREGVVPLCVECHSPHEILRRTDLILGDVRRDLGCAGLLQVARQPQHLARQAEPDRDVEPRQLRAAAREEVGGNCIDRVPHRFGLGARLGRRAAGLVEAGVLKTTLTANLGRIDAANLRRAHKMLEEGHVIGKLVLEGW